MQRHAWAQVRCVPLYVEQELKPCWRRRDVDAARTRLAEHRCRLLARGIAASPTTGPGYCPQDVEDAL